MKQELLRRDAVERVTGMRRSTLYAKVATGDFPRPVKIGPRAVGWPSNEVEAWVNARIAEREAAKVAG
jgi:prophage regulatory protein